MNISPLPAAGVCRRRLDLRHAELATDKYGEARRLSGLIHASSGHREYYVTCQLFADNGTPISLPTQTKHTSFAKRVTWQEWVTLPIAYRDLPADAVRTPPPARPPTRPPAPCAPQTPPARAQHIAR